MIPVLSVLLVVALSLIVTRVASVALVHTGLSREAARFQARSAFSGVGFTTSEAESVVGHPVRRRIIMWLMLIGNAGIITAIAALALSFIGMEGAGGLWTFAVLAGGIVLLLLLASSSLVERRTAQWISWALNRYTDLEARDFARLLHLRDDYGVSELRVTADDWIAGKTLAETGIAREGLIVLGIECPGDRFIGAPEPDTEVRDGDLLVLYGRTPRIRELDLRASDRAGDERHDEAVAEQERVARDERQKADR